MVTRRGRWETVCARCAYRALLGGPSTSPLEVAMEYSFTPWVAARARRLRLYRLLVNSFWFLIPVILVLNLLRLLFPAASPVLWAALWIPFGTAIYILAIPWLVTGVGFSWGMIKCPACDRRFTRGFSPWIPKTCQNCGFNIYTLDRGATSNQRLERP